MSTGGWAGNGRFFTGFGEETVHHVSIPPFASDGVWTSYEEELRLRDWSLYDCNYCLNAKLYHFFCWSLAASLGLFFFFFFSFAIVPVVVTVQLADDLTLCRAAERNWSGIFHAREVQDRKAQRRQVE